MQRDANRQTMVRLTLSDGRYLHRRHWRGEGSPLVLLHGLLGSSASWREFALASRRPCFAFDLPGFGRSSGRVIDCDASQKAARFIRICDAFRLPLVVLVDTPGYLPGVQQEAVGVIRHGADLLRAFAQATVPRITVVLRKAFGGAYITMNSKDLGAHLYLAWSDSELGIMGPHAAVDIIRRLELTASSELGDLRERLAREYRCTHLSAAAAARAGHVDDVIAPNQTRMRISWALGALA